MTESRRLSQAQHVTAAVHAADLNTQAFNIKTLHLCMICPDLPAVPAQLTAQMIILLLGDMQRAVQVTSLAEFSDQQSPLLPFKKMVQGSERLRSFAKLPDCLALASWLCTTKKRWALHLEQSMARLCIDSCVGILPSWNC